MFLIVTSGLFVPGSLCACAIPGCHDKVSGIVWDRWRGEEGSVGSLVLKVIRLTMKWSWNPDFGMQAASMCVRNTDETAGGWESWGEGGGGLK